MAMATQSTQARTTAPVVKYVCLFTPDLKRKHKRWQDGRLEFHTFNRRVMVYDEGGNVIGDAHRTKSHDVEEGDEFQLDRGNVIVQVAERVGQRVQDITDIFARKPKPQGSNPTSTPAGTATPRAKSSIPNSQMRHLPLQSLLSTPGRQIGRAVIPSTSPFERRQTLSAADHPFKKRKLDAVRTNNKPSATVLPDSTSAPPCQPTTPAPREAPRRKVFSPPRVRNLDHAPTTAPNATALSGISSKKSNPACSERIDLTSTATASRPEKQVRSEGVAATNECRQPPCSPTRRPKNASKYKAPTPKQDSIPGKENPAALAQKGSADAPSRGKPLAPNNQPAKAAQVDQPPEPRPPDGPTTALRLGSAQKRGLLVVKGPPARRRRRDEIPAQGANGKMHHSSRGAAVPETGLELQQETPARPANGGTLAGSRGPPPAKPALKTGLQQREETAQPANRLVGTGGPAGAKPAPKTVLRQQDETSTQPANRGISAGSGGLAGTRPVPETAPEQRDEAPAQPTNGMTRVSSRGAAGAASETAPLVNAGHPGTAPSLPANAQKSAGGQPAAAAAKPNAKSPAGGGPWSRESDDLLDYKRSAAVEPAK